MIEQLWPDATVDLVAREIWFANTLSQYEWWESLHETTKSLYRTRARSMLAAMSNAGMILCPVDAKEIES